MRRKNQSSLREPCCVNRHPCHVRAWALIHQKHRTDIFNPAVLQHACFGRRALRFTFQFTPSCHAGSRFASRSKTRVVMPARASSAGVWCVAAWRLSGVAAGRHSGWEACGLSLDRPAQGRIGAVLACARAAGWRPAPPCTPCAALLAALHSTLRRPALRPVLHP